MTEGPGDLQGERELFAQLSRAFGTLQERSRRELARHGLTPHEFAVLEGLHRRGPLLLGEIQEAVQVSSGGITYLVDRLAGRGFVERQDCPGDRRARYAALTTEGRSFVEGVAPAHDRALAAGTSALGPGEVREVTRLLRALERGARGRPGGTP